jgi:hypothetical protein
MKDRATISPYNPTLRLEVDGFPTWFLPITSGSLPSAQAFLLSKGAPKYDNAKNQDSSAKG